MNAIAERERGASRKAERSEAQQSRELTGDSKVKIRTDTARVGPV